nr:glutaredoxin family protein [Cytobacillus eiseniae]
MRKIILYTQPECPPCEITKRFLTEYGFRYEEKNIKQNQAANKELIQKYQSFSTPTIIIDDTIIITGFNLEKLKQELHIQD